MNVDSIIFLISDFAHMPAAYKTQILSEKTVTAYINEYPEICQAYIKELMR